VLDDRTQESVSDGICAQEDSGAELARRRRINRECMRRRRADPSRCAQEREKRKHRQHKIAASSASFPTSVPQPMGRVCAICHLRAAVEEIIRLEPSESTRGGYVQLRLPYCGRC
jgi:hypothetical protein